MKEGSVQNQIRDYERKLGNIESFGRKGVKVSDYMAARARSDIAAP